MKKLYRTTSCILFSTAVLLSTPFAVASGNGGGEEPPKTKTRSAVSICSFLPFVCVDASSGNGGGDEPPVKE